MTRGESRLLRQSLVAVWLVTALVSVVELQGQSGALLREAGWPAAGWVQPVVLAGALLDGLLGVWLWWRPGRPAYAAALTASLGMTAIASWLLPSLWLHPLGPLFCRTGRAVEGMRGMNGYLVLKCLHVLSSVLLVGTGFGSAFYMFFANRSGNVAAQALVTRLVVRADWWFTTPAGLFQPLSGFALAHLAGWPWHTPWLMTALALYLFVGACWLPVVRLQLRMAAVAATAHREGHAVLPAAYWRDAALWEALGYPAFVAMLAVFYLMVAKPVLWG